MKQNRLCMLLWASLVSVNAFSVVSPKKTGLFSSHVKTKTSPQKNSLVLTYLEINCWLVSICGVTILIDPLLEGPLDFGIPKLYAGKKRFIPASGMVKALPPIDCILLTQGLDDHAHVRTLQKLHQLCPSVPIVAPPSAGGALEASGFCDSQGRCSQVRFLKHQEQCDIFPSKEHSDPASSILIRATEGALVGPPWQRRENGYILSNSKHSKTFSPSVYIEPHVEFNSRELSQLGPVDVVITPISGQALPAFELVHGPKDAIRLAEILQPKYLIPMQNGDIDMDGPVSKFVSEVGSPIEFRERLTISKLGTELLEVIPGVDMELSF